MHHDWEHFLRSRGAVIEQGHVRDFGRPEQERLAAPAGNVMVDLSHFSLVRATGDDAETFLQGQFSNDLRVLDAGTQLHAYCNAQGRMLAVVRVFRHQGQLFLQFPQTLEAATIKRLRMFVLRAKVSLEPATDVATMGLSGPAIPELLKAASLPWPSQVNACLAHDQVTIVRLPGPQPRCQLVGNIQVLQSLWTRLAQAQPVGASVWAWLDIMAGLPQVFAQTVEAFVPQMTNLDLVGGISFTKGCYPGQEIVARTHYLGRLKQRMYRAHVDSDVSPQPGAPLFAPNFGEQAAGTVVDAQPSPGGGCDLLAVIQISSVNDSELHLVSLDGPRLHIEQLPYSFSAPPTAAN